MTVLIAGVFFHRLEINHDTHEFILDSGIITNTYNTQNPISQHFKVLRVFYHTQDETNTSQLWIFEPVGLPAISYFMCRLLSFGM
jgi:hypothetical protein